MSFRKNVSRLVTHRQSLPAAGGLSSAGGPGTRVIVPGIIWITPRFLPLESLRYSGMENDGTSCRPQIFP